MVRAMKRTALIIVLLTACGGGGKKSSTAPDTTDQARTEPGTPTEPASGGTPEPQKAAEPDPAVAAKAELTAQLEAGKKVYADKGCAKCHGDDGAGSKTSPPVIGDKALPEAAPKTAKLRKGVKFTTAKDLHDFIKKEMPLKKGGTLSDEESAAVTAWILSENKVTLEKKLDAEGAAGLTLARK